MPAGPGQPKDAGWMWPSRWKTSKLLKPVFPVVSAPDHSNMETNLWTICGLSFFLNVRSLKTALQLFFCVLSVTLNGTRVGQFQRRAVCPWGSSSDFPVAFFHPDGKKKEANRRGGLLLRKTTQSQLNRTLQSSLPLMCAETRSAQCARKEGKA